MRALTFDSTSLPRFPGAGHGNRRRYHMRGLWIPITLVGALALAGCSDPPQKSPKARRAIPGLQDQRVIRALLVLSLRVVAPQSSTASCQTDEIMISAYCTGTFTNYPLVPLTNGARCGANPNSTTLRVTIVCAKR